VLSPVIAWSPLVCSVGLRASKCCQGWSSVPDGIAQVALAVRYAARNTQARTQLTAAMTAGHRDGTGAPGGASADPERCLGNGVQLDLKRFARPGDISMGILAARAV
jgi:hypothetical protein